MKLDYLQRIQLAAQLPHFVSNPNQVVLEAAVEHADKCVIFRGKTCTCTPDIKIIFGEETWSVDDEGVPHQL